MAAAIIPLATSLLPVIVPEVKNIISLIHTAFHKQSYPASPSAPAPVPQGNAKMDTAITLVQGLLTSLQGSGVIIPNRDAIQGFIEGLYQTMKQGGELPKPPVPVPDMPVVGTSTSVAAPFKGTVLNLGLPPVDDSNRVVVSIKADGRTVMVTP